MTPPENPRHNTPFFEGRTYPPKAWAIYSHSFTFPFPCRGGSGIVNGANQKPCPALQKSEGKAGGPASTSLFKPENSKICVNAHSLKSPQKSDGHIRGYKPKPLARLA